MQSTRFHTFLTSNIDINEDVLKQLTAGLKIIKIKKGDFLLRENEVCQHTFFVEKGLLKQYSVDSKGKEHILQFAPENWFMTDRESVFFKRPSQYYIQALEDSEVLMLDEMFFTQLSLSNKSFLEFNTRLLHNHIRHLQKRITLLQSASAEERYLDFIQIYPDILLRVPQTLVASYLGITPEGLSRVRKELAGKNFKSKTS